MNMSDVEKKIYLVKTNTDLTEGRGFQYPIAYCEILATAKRLAKGKGVMGSDANVVEYTCIKVNGEWVAPFNLVTPSQEDVGKQKKIDARNEAIKKAKEAGLSDEDIKNLGIL